MFILMRPNGQRVMVKGERRADVAKQKLEWMRLDSSTSMNDEGGPFHRLLIQCAAEGVSADFKVGMKVEDVCSALRDLAAHLEQRAGVEPEARPLGWASRTDVENLRDGTFYASFLMVSKHGPGDQFSVPVYEGPRAMKEGSAAEFVRQAIKEKLARETPKTSETKPR